MTSFWMQKWIDDKMFVAVEHTNQSYNNLLTCLVLKNKKNALSLVESYSVESISNLKDKLSKNIGVSIVINTDKVLTKVMDNSLPVDKILFSAFPTIKLSDFYYEIVQNEQLSIVSVCRKSEVDSILSEYEKNKIQVISFSLGNNAVFELESYIKNNSIQTSNAILYFDHTEIKSFEFTNSVEKTKYSVNDLEIANSQVLCLGSILHSIVGSTNSQNNFGDLINEKKDKYRHQKVFQKVLRLGLGFLFALLLVNILLYSSYQGKIAKWEQENASNQQTKRKILILEKDVKTQKKLINEMFQSSGSHTTYMLDDFVSIMPKTISLLSIQYQPILKKIKPNTEIQVQKNEMLIKGIIASDIDFTNWVETLEGKNWVNSVVILEYGAPKGTTNFTIKIIINDDWEK